mmetsp:Transcript_42409/g.135900  ORF Transcript_42409/g.135900 Transcript_42409/m.135900 type:complete len:276 (-) Transcript_42409:1331-2158(-)
MEWPASKGQHGVLAHRRVGETREGIEHVAAPRVVRDDYLALVGPRRGEDPVVPRLPHDRRPPRGVPDQILVLLHEPGLGEVHLSPPHVPFRPLHLDRSVQGPLPKLRTAARHVHRVSLVALILEGELHAGTERCHDRDAVGYRALAAAGDEVVGGRLHLRQDAALPPDLSIAVGEGELEQAALLRQRFDPRNGASARGLVLKGLLVANDRVFQGLHLLPQMLRLRPRAPELAGGCGFPRVGLGHALLRRLHRCRRRALEPAQLGLHASGAGLLGG